ncbi:MAG: CotH kinase family protein, partial [Sedimentisphaerales bacterium]
GFDTDAAYYRVQGRNPDGTPNPRYERLVDVDNLIDYMLCTFYVGDCDGPVSNFLGNSRPNNYFCIFNRVNPDGFKFFRHDGEHTLGVRDWCYDRTGPYSAGQQFAQFNPQWLHQQLAANSEYRVRFGDRAHKVLFNNGLLTPGQSTARLMERAGQIETAIIAESARWGDSKRSSPFTRDDHWQPEIDRIVNDYEGYGFPSRTQVLLGQLRAKGWYPNVDAPVLQRLEGR